MASLHFQHSSWLSPPLTKKPTSSIPFPSKSSPFKVSLSLNPSNAETSRPSSETKPEHDSGPVDPVKLAFERAKAYRKAADESNSVKVEQKSDSVSSGGGGLMGKEGGEKAVPDSVKVAMEKAKEYKKNKAVSGGGAEGIAMKEANSGLQERNGEKLGARLMDKSSSKTDKLSISSIDFKGLNFADKKSGRGLPAGLIPITDPFPEGDIPEVEILVGDTSKFGDTSTSTSKPSQDGNFDFYKPKVSTWGVFPRPGNISKTFGGGRNIRPGEALETAEERAAKDKRTRELLAAYKKKVGINIDPKVKSECEKALNDGDSLMDSGKLSEALPYYQTVMDKLPFQSELHGLAALQWSICQDSLSRRNEARAVYEKLQSHPNAKVSKRARQFRFSFQAMEMMKVTGSNFLPQGTGYQNYFEAFIEDKANYPVGDAENQESELSQALPYMIFLLSPILLVLFIAIQQGNMS